MSVLPVAVPVSSHTQERVHVAPDPVPEVGLSWGRASEFSILDPADDEAAEADRRGGLTIRWAPKHVWRDQTHDLSPVWRSYDVARIRAADDPDISIEVAFTRSMLFPIRTERVKYIGGGSYVVEDQGRPYEERVVHSYVRLDMPLPDLDLEIVDPGRVEGQWPDYPEEMFSPGQFSG